MLQRVLIVYIAGILLCDLLLGLGPWREKRWQRQDVAVSTGYPYVDSLRAGCASLLLDAGLDSATVGLAQGVLLGDKQLLQSEQKQEMRRAGMSHLLAVSGLHIGIIWGLLSLLLRPLVLIDRRGCYRWLILLLLWGYIAVIGFPTSAIRAGVMISMVQCSWFLQRDVWGWHNLCSAALLILLFQPSQLYEVGFQLSFLATAGILAAAPWLQQECPKHRDPATGRHNATWPMRIYWRCRQLLILTLSAQFFTFPVVAYHFHSIPLFGWIQGFLVVPVIAVFVYLLLLLLLFALLASLFGWTLFASLGLQLSWCVEQLAHWISFVAHITVRLESFCLGGKLEWYPNLLETIGLLMLLVLIAWFITFSTYRDKK